MALTGLSGLSVLPFGGAQAYYEKILGYNPTVCFPSWETAGVVAEELVHGWNGTYARNVTLMGTQAGPDGGTAPTFDGIQDRVNIFSAGLAAAFNPNLYSSLVWARVSGVGVWTDGAFRMAIHLITNNNNRAASYKNNGNNQFRTYHRGGGAALSYTMAGAEFWLDWRAIVQTVNVAANRHYLYIAGVPYLSGDALNAWVGALAAANLGSDHTPGAWWSGGLAFGTIFSGVELSQAQVTDLSTV